MNVSRGLAVHVLVGAIKFIVHVRLCTAYYYMHIVLLYIFNMYFLTADQLKSTDVDQDKHLARVLGDSSKSKVLPSQHQNK